MKLPSEWAEFHSHSANKEGLFRYMSVVVNEYSFQSKDVIVTSGIKVYSQNRSVPDFPDCNQEEAETRITLHQTDALSRTQVPRYEIWTPTFSSSLQACSTNCCICTVKLKFDLRSVSGGISLTTTT